MKDSIAANIFVAVLASAGSVQAMTGMGFNDLAGGSNQIVTKIASALRDRVASSTASRRALGLRTSFAKVISLHRTPSLSLANPRPARVTEGGEIKPTPQ